MDQIATELRRWKIEDNKILTKSRYSKDDRIQYEDGYSQIETHDAVSISQDNTDKFYRLPYGEENRLDLVSWKFYDTPMYWWIIAYASNIQDPLNVPAETLLRIPDLTRALGEMNSGK